MRTMQDLNAPSRSGMARLALWFSLAIFLPELPGAQDSDHWAFQSLTKPVPPTRLMSPDASPIDAFIAARLAQSGLAPSRPADRVTLIRRLYLDLHGLPPRPEEVEDFARSDDPRAYERLVDELLASPRYGERWAQHWLDVVRFADTDGYEVNTERRHAWPYRDYVIRSFNEDKPYNAFVFEQLAGDTVGEDAALGFMVAAAALLPGQIGQDDASKRLARQDALDEIIVGTAETFLGLTVGCARCHDHKFDPISQRDYFAMQAFFAGVEYGERPRQGAAARAWQKERREIDERLANLSQELAKHEPAVFPGQTVVIDDEAAARVTSLIAKSGHGQNPDGRERGHAQDAGSEVRSANVSGGRYTWWDNVPGRDVAAYHPAVEGEFRIWLSWGVHGSGAHTRDARYVLDADGDVESKHDQRQIACVDQYHFAGVREGETEKQPLWSGFLDAGIHRLQPDSRILLRGGETGTAITADVIVLKESAHEAGASKWPVLRPPVNPRRNVERFNPRPARFVRFTALATEHGNQREPCLDELEVYAAGSDINVALAERGARATSSGNHLDPGRHELEHINDGRHGNGRSWISDTLGGGWVQIEWSKPAVIDKVVWGRDREGKFQDRLAVAYRVETALAPGEWETASSSEDREPYGTPHDEFLFLSRQLTPAAAPSVRAALEDYQAMQARRESLGGEPMVFAGTFREPDVTRVLYRGDPEQPREVVPPSVLGVLGDTALAPDAPERERRVALARWITRPDHPLTARVMVNRLWQHHFGIGIVETASDFGANGARPSHPELLDWLAGEFRRAGWSVKHMHRLMVLSQTYRQSNRVDPQAMEVDADNRLLWRFASRRLEAEAIRDSILRVNGRLNLEMGGPGFDFFKSRGGLNGFPPEESFGPEGLRRMIYAHKVRMERVPVFGAFDCPDAGRAAPIRHRSTTAIQALNLFNSPFVNGQAAAFADAVRDRTGERAEITALIEEAFRMALSRAPNKREMAAARRTVAEHGLAALCRVLYNTSEFLYMP